VQIGSLIHVSETSTKEALSSETLVSTSQKSVFSKEIFVSLRRDVVSTERKDYVTQTELTFLHLHRLIFIIVCKKSKGKTIPVEALRVPGG
jgi:GTP:adenosylcobinamide-phosphate guanylyltransferase